MHTLTRLIRGTTLTAMTLSGVLLCAVMLLLVANVALRLLGAPIFGLYEILSALAVMLLGLSLGDSQREKQHVAIDLLTNTFPARVREAIAVGTTLLSILVFATIAYALVRYATLQVRAATATELLKLPNWPTITVLTLGIVLLLLVLLLDGGRRVKALITGTEVKETW